MLRLLASLLFLFALPLAATPQQDAGTTEDVRTRLTPFM